MDAKSVTRFTVEGIAGRAVASAHDESILIWLEVRQLRRSPHTNRGRGFSRLSPTLVLTTNYFPQFDEDYIPRSRLQIVRADRI